MAELDLETIRHALTVARQKGLSEVRLESGEHGFSATFDPKASSPSAPKAAVRTEEPSASEPADGPKPIPAPAVGFYRATDSVLQVGKHVSKGDIVASISALGLANDVESPISGEIVEVLVQPDQPVEYGQALAYVKVS